MTTTTGTTEHPDVSEISDLTEGLLSPTRSVELHRHLDGCSLCADVYESLEDIRGLLGSLPGPPRMPADVAARVDAALAAEALLNATAPDPLAADATADVSRETSRAADASETDEPVPAATHTTVTPVAGATVADTLRADRPAGRPRAATGPGRTRQQRRRRSAILGAVFGTAAIGVSVLLFQSSSLMGDGDKTASSADAGARPANGTDPAFSGIRVQDKVHSLLTPTPATGKPRAAEGQDSTKEAPGTSASPKLMQQVPPCIQQGTGRTDPPLAAEQGTYEGIDAFLVVLSDPNDGKLVRAYVIDAACVDVVPPVKGELLLTQSYPRR